MERWFCSPESPIFQAISALLDSGLWFRVSGAVAGAAVSCIAVSLFSGPSAEGSLTFGVVSTGCALANVAAFASYRPQIRPLIGAGGLSPAADVLRRMRHVPFRRAPTAFRFVEDCGDETLMLANTVGLASSLALVALLLGRFAVPSVARVAVPLLWCVAGWAYLSLLAVSGDFLGLQSDSNLVEVDALMAVLALVAPGHPQAAVLAVRFFAFRKMLGCGVCKYYGSSMWREFSALGVHYFTQPLVNPRSYYAHHMPLPVHKFSVMATFVVEVVLPFCTWGPRPLRLLAWMGFNGLNAMINLSGNYGFIGFLNTMENLSFTDDRLWGRFLWPALPPVHIPSAVRALVAPVLATYIGVSLLPLARAAKGSVSLKTLMLPGSLADWLVKVDEAQHPFRLVNYQGKFSGMHDFRWEPVLEGSDDGGVTWRQFRWRYKLNPGPGERGVVLWLHLPRLDWRVWFLPLAAARGREPPTWYYRLLDKLAQEDPGILGLMRGSPFRGRGGLMVRSRLVRCEVAKWGAAGGDAWTFRPLQGRTPMDLVVGAPGGAARAPDGRRAKAARRA